MLVSLALRYEIEEVCAEYAAVLDAADFEKWPECVTAPCFYAIIARENADRGLPLALMRCESKGMRKDRVVAMRDTMRDAPRSLRHITSGMRVTGQTADALTVAAH